MRHGGPWSFNYQIERFGPIFFRGYEFFFLKED